MKTDLSVLNPDIDIILARLVTYLIIQKLPLIKDDIS